MLPKSGEVGLPTVREAARYRVESVRAGSPAGTPEARGWIQFCRAAEEGGIDSVLISFSRYEPDPALVACAIGRETSRLGFILAVRSGLLSPTLFVQQVNTLSGLLGRGRRVSVNLVAGSSRTEQQGYGDHLEHDQRYARAGEFLDVCRRLWTSGGAPVELEGIHYKIADARLLTQFVGPSALPEIFLSGHSPAAIEVATRHASCWLRVIDAPAALRDSVAVMRSAGLEVCLRACVLCRPTREEAIAVTEELLADPVVSGRDGRERDSHMYRDAPEGWLSPSLWAGLARARGPVWTTLLGTPDEVAAALHEYGRIGVTQLILSGWPELDELTRFTTEVLPRLRALETARSG